MLTDELLNYLFDGQPHILMEPMAAWLDSSRRFTTFVSAAREKIRKKLRVIKDTETLYDLLLELETAFLLLQERALSVVYEPEQSRQVRSPDFAVTFTTSLTFMVEVTRVRAASSSDNSQKTPLEGERLADSICSKLGQLLPQRSNVLIVGLDNLSLTQSDLNSWMLRIQQRAEQENTAFVKRYGFQDRSDFFRYYQGLSEVLLRRSQLQVKGGVISWVNTQAKHPLPSKVRTALYRSHKG